MNNLQQKLEEALKALTASPWLNSSETVSKAKASIKAAMAEADILNAKADASIDPFLQKVIASRYTPVILVLAAASCFAFGFVFCGIQ